MSRRRAARVGVAGRPILNGGTSEETLAKLVAWDTARACWATMTSDEATPEQRRAAGEAWHRTMDAWDFWLEWEGPS